MKICVYKIKKRHILCAALLLLLPAAFALRAFFAVHPDITEHFYSRSVYPVLSDVLSKYFALFPFSYAEFFLYSLVLFGFFLIIRIIYCAVHRQFKPAMRIIAVAACICTTGFFLFNIMWGFNYCRLPLEKSLGYKAGTPTPAELAAAMTKERNAVNLLCSSGSIHFSGGHSHYSGGFYKIADSVNNGYYALTKDTAESNGIINNIQPHPKSITASGLLSYTGIAGIFIPFTYESNVNTDPGMPDFTLPFSATHESAHFKGFAREDEANFIAYLASSHNSDPYFQYSAHLEAFIYLSNALFTADYSAWQHINSGLDLRAAGDLKYFNDFLTAHQSKVTEISEKVNDNYLKSQGQQGIVSYDLFVTLLCDRYRSK